MPRRARTPPTSLTARERQFFGLIAEAVFANPFGDEREEILRKILGREAGATSARDDRAELLHREVAQRLRRLESAKLATLDAFQGEDREILKIVFLFDAYHFCYGRLQAHIDEQIRAGDRPCAVRFAAEVLAFLQRRGFTPEEARRYFSLFYQLRRAHRFIDKGLTGRCPSMKELRRQLWNSVITHDIRWYDSFLMDRMEDFSTLLLGETGTGKGTAAAAIGRAGLIPFDEKNGVFVESFTRSFMAINLSLFPEPLIEAELFGHKKGAFTGAVDDHEGVFARCSPHGSILLDEIGEVSVPVQIKLLQVLQERVFSPVGGHERQHFRGRVIAATNRSLEKRGGRGVFRDDFYYRLCSNIIRVPPLRTRLAEDPGELDALLMHVLTRMAGEGAETLLDRVRDAIRRCLPESYAWPGNVRELEQCVRSILVTNGYQADKAIHSTAPRQRFFEGMGAGTLSAHEVLAAYCALLFERHGTLAEVARRTQLDRRTVKKYVEESDWGKAES